MNDRRSMSEALKMTPKELDFINKGPPKITQGTVTPPQRYDNVESRSEQQPVTQTEPEAPSGDASHVDRRIRPRKEKGLQVKPNESPALTTPIVPITIRFRQATAEALRRASLERRLGGVSPATQQEIVEAALSQWLRDNT